jgi:carbonic anhydrase/acetyltransferase-like protein (isoleucine patch superfamily)
MPDLEQQLNQFLLRNPVMGRDVFIAPGAVVVGDVTLGDHCTVWYNAVVRADFNRIVIGHHTNIQDNCVLHLADSAPCIVGNHVTIGHGAVAHGCTIEDEALIGMNATVLDGAIVGRGALVGANSFVPMGMRVPPGTLAVGSPAKVIRGLTPEETAIIRGYADKYCRTAEFYLRNGIRPV